MSCAPAGYFVVIVTCWSWLLSFKVTCSISLLSVNSKMHCYYNHYCCSSLQPPTLLPQCEGRPSSLCFCSTIFTIHPMADCQNCGVVVLGLCCSKKKCGVVVLLWCGCVARKKLLCCCDGVALPEKKLCFCCCGVALLGKKLWCGCVAGEKIVVLL